MGSRATASDPNVIGKSINLDGDPYVIVGVMGPEDDQGPDSPRCGRLLAFTGKEAAVRGKPQLPLHCPPENRVSTLSEAQSEMNTISQRLEQTYPEDDKGWGAIVNSMARGDGLGTSRPALLMMLGAVAFVLLIACANVANLILARAPLRVAKRSPSASALGANRSRIIPAIT